MAPDVGDPRDLLVQDVSYFLDELAREALSGAAEDRRRVLVQRCAQVMRGPHSAETPPLPPAPRALPQPEEEDMYEAADCPMVEEEEEYEEFPNQPHPGSQHVPPQLPGTLTSGQEEDIRDVVTPSTLMRSAAKYGALYRKERFIFVDQFRRCWAAVDAGCLFLFASDKDTKPATAHPLSGYQARPAPYVAKDAKKKDLYFEIFCPGKKTHQYIARTQKDMSQWVATINAESSRSPNSPRDSSPPLPSPTAKHEVTKNKSKRLRRLPSLPSNEDDTSSASAVVEEDSDSSCSTYEQMPSDEEIYYNIPEVLAAPAEEQSPATPARPSCHEEEEEVEYHDICNTEDAGSYYNMETAPRPPPPSVVMMAPPSHPAPHPPAEEEDEAFYDDVGSDFQPPVRPPGDKPTLKSFQCPRPPASKPLPTPPSSSTKPSLHAGSNAPPKSSLHSSVAIKEAVNRTQSGTFELPPGFSCGSFIAPQSLPSQPPQPPQQQQQQPEEEEDFYDDVMSESREDAKPPPPAASQKPSQLNFTQELGMRMKSKPPPVPSAAGKPTTPGTPDKSPNPPLPGAGKPANNFKPHPPSTPDRQGPSVPNRTTPGLIKTTPESTPNTPKPFGQNVPKPPTPGHTHSASNTPKPFGQNTPKPPSNSTTNTPKPFGQNAPKPPPPGRVSSNQKPAVNSQKPGETKSPGVTGTRFGGSQTSNSPGGGGRGKFAKPQNGGNAKPNTMGGRANSGNIKNLIKQMEANMGGN